MLKKTTILKNSSILFFLFIFLNDHTVFSDFFETSSTYFLVLATLLLLISVFSSGKLYSNKKMWLFFLSWAVSVLIPCVLAGLTSLVFVRFCYWFALLLMLLVLEYAGIDYRDILLETVKILCIWCYICYFYTLLGFDFLPVTNVSKSLLYNWFKVELHGYIIYENLVPFSLGTISIIKLYSPLGEPGIASMYFNFAIIWLLFFKDNADKSNKRWTYLFSIAVLLSLSMIGILVLFAVYTIYAVKKGKALAIIFLSITIVVASTILIIQKLSTESYTQRSNDYIVMYKVITKSLPFGIGLGNIDTSASLLSSTSETVGFYCGLLYPLAQYGLFGSIYYYVMCVACCKFSDDGFSRAAFLVFFFLTLLTQPQADECFILAFLFSGVIRSSKCSWRNRNPMASRREASYRY